MGDWSGTAPAGPRHPFAPSFLLLGLIALAAAASFVLDDPAAEMVASAPRSLRRRTAGRAIAIALPFAVGVAGIALIDQRNPDLPFVGVLLEMSGALVVGFATSAAFGVFRATPGEIAGTVVGIGLLVLAFTNPLGRWVTVFALSPDDLWARTATLWLALLLVAVAVIAWATRDPLDA
jgi:hypothetical protein